MATTEILLWILAALLVVVGIAGTVLPAIPGAPLVFAGLLIAAWSDGFARVGMVTLVVLGTLTAVTFVVDLLATRFGAKRVGAHPRALLGATLGTIAGLFFGIPGLFLGPFLGAAIGEWTVRRQLVQAGRAGVGAWIGLVLGVAAKLAIVITMLGVFATSYLF